MTFLDRLLGRTPTPTPVPVVRSDGWSNLQTGIGTSRDATQYSQFVRDLLIPDVELSNLYYGDDLAATIVDAILDQAFRKGFYVKAEDNEGAEDFQKWSNEALDIETQFQLAATWGRVYGGAILVLGALDGLDMAAPLNEKNVGPIEWTQIFDRRFVTPYSWYRNPGPKLGTPEVYRVYMSGNGGIMQSGLVHETRCIRFEGTPVDRLKALEAYQGWSLSVLQRPYPVLRDFGAAFGGVSNMLRDASQGVFSMKGLISMMASNQRTAIYNRMQLLDMGRSTARSIVLDADGEKFEKVATAFAGVSDVLDRYMQRLSAASEGIPVSILMGRSAAGMNATGDLDMDSWFGKVEAYQSKRLGPSLKRLYTTLSLAKNSPTRGPLKGMSIEWHKLSQPSITEEATAYSTRATADVAYVNAGVFDPAEIAIARAGRGEYSTDVPEIDVKRLQVELKARATFEPPDPNAPPPTDAPVKPTVQ